MKPIFLISDAKIFVAEWCKQKEFVTNRMVGRDRIWDGLERNMGVHHQFFVGWVVGEALSVVVAFEVLSYFMLNGNISCI